MTPLQILLLTSMAANGLLGWLYLGERDALTEARSEASQKVQEMACTLPRLHTSTPNWEPQMRKSPCYLMAVLASTAALSACSTTSASPPAGWACEPLPATLRVRPRPLPDLELTPPPPATQASAPRPRR